MKNFIIFLLLSIATTGVVAQDKPTEEAAVLRVVKRLFDGMRLADSAMVGKTFMKDAQLYTALTDKSGQPVLQKGSLQTFLNAIGSPHDEVWNEPLWDTEVRIDGNLAQVWTKYAFYLGNKFSHCGVDAFHLFKTAEGWKIFHLTDTREFRNCTVPDHIKRKYGK